MHACIACPHTFTTGLLSACVDMSAAASIGVTAAGTVMTSGAAGSATSDLEVTRSQGHKVGAGLFSHVYLY